MLSKEIIEAIGDTQALEKIRPDLNIEKWTIWQPANSRNAPSVRVFEREVTLDDGSKLTAQVEIGFTHRGVLTTEDQKTYYALLKQWEDKGCSKEHTYFSLRELARLLDKRWGKTVPDSLTKSLRRLSVTPLIWRNSYYDKETKETINETDDFRLLSKLKIIEKERDGAVNKAVGYFQFDKHILTNLLSNYTTPLLFDIAIGFKSEIAQLLYPHIDLLMNDKFRYERRTEGLFDDLGLKGKRYVYPSVRKQVLEPALKELEGKPLSSGVLASVTLKKTSDGKDYKAVFIKKAYPKQRKKSQRIQPPLAGSESGLVYELHKRGIKPEEVAVKLVETCSEDHIRLWIDIYDAGGLDGAGGLREALEKRWQPRDEQLEKLKRFKTKGIREQVVELNREREKLKAIHADQCNTIFDEIIVKYPEAANDALKVVMSNSLFTWDYDESKPYGEQTEMAMSMARPELRERFPDMFKATDEEYEEKNSEMDEKIQKLQTRFY